MFFGRVTAGTPDATLWHPAWSVGGYRWGVRRVISRRLGPVDTRVMG